MKTLVINDVTLSNRIEQRIEAMAGQSRRLSSTEFMLSLVAVALDRLDALDAEKPGSGTNDFMKSFVNFKRQRGRKPGSARHVIRVEDGKEYDSCDAAALDVGVSSIAIRHAVTGRIKTVRGYRWQYADEPGIEERGDFFEDD